MNPKERLIVALDVDTRDRALALVETLRQNVKFFKIGLELFSSCGPGIVGDVKANGCEVFLDLKLHDIPTTVAKTAVVLTKLGVNIFNIHALGGYEMMNRASEAVKAEAKRLSIPKPKLIAVTILTSMDAEALKDTGVTGPVKEEVLKLALLAKRAGLDGVVSSPEEISAIRKAAGEEFVIVTPGVRPSWSASDDQKRVATPGDAVSAGADFIVVGRPVTAAADPVEAAKRIIKEMIR